MRKTLPFFLTLIPSTAALAPSGQPRGDFPENGDHNNPHETVTRPYERANCLGDVEFCHDHVESLINAGDPLIASNVENQSKNLLPPRKKKEMVVLDDAFFQAKQHLEKGSRGGKGGKFSKIVNGNKKRVLSPYVNFCDKRVSDYHIFDFINSDRICKWGEKDKQVALALDKHTYTLSHMAGGEQQIYDRIEAQEGIVPHLVATLDLCHQFREKSMQLFAMSSNTELTNPDRMDDMTFSNRLMKLHEVDRSLIEKLEPVQDEVTQKAGGELQKILNTSANQVAMMLTSGDKDMEYMNLCTDEENPNVNTERSGRTALVLALSLKISQFARLMMDHTRTAIAMKMLWREVGGGFNATPDMLPNYNFAPVGYGRHWDMLDALLLGLQYRDDGDLLFDREYFLPQNQLKELRLRPIRFIEIGVAVGQNGNYLLERYPNLHYTGVDPTIRDEVRDRFKSRFPSSRYRFYADLSENVVDNFEEEEFDFIFVDGPHTYKNVATDIVNYTPKLKTGGLLIGHDFSCVHPPLLWGVSEPRVYGGIINYGMDGTWWWVKE